MLSEGGGNVTERNSSSENNSPRKCDKIVFADACKYEQIRFNNNNVVIANSSQCISKQKGHYNI